MSGAGNVYLLRHGATSWYKIGRTINTAAKRICTGLATGNPEGLTEVTSWFCETRHGDFEGYLHALFQKHHLHGRAATEFFDFTGVYTEEELVAIISKEFDTFTVDLIPENKEVPVQVTDEMKVCNEQIAELVKERRALAATVKMAEIRMRSVDILLKQYIDGNAGLMDDERRPLFTWKSHQRQSLDTTALRENHPDIAAAFTKSSTSRTFLMT
jgi:hypothetical protein